MENLEKTKKNKLYFITFLQVVGPIFVILGHAKNGLPYNDFLQGMRTFIYVFHMPLFFFISAYLFSYKKGMNQIAYKDWIKKKAWRLLFPYVILNLIFIVPKFIFSDFIQDNMEMSFQNFFVLCINPRANILGHLWFLFALFEIYLLSPLWNYMVNKKNKIVWVIAFSIAILLRLYATTVTDVLAINDLSRNLLFFLLGLFIGTLPVQKLENKSTKTNFIIYALAYIISLVFWIQAKNIYTTTILCAISLLVLLKIPLVFHIKSNILEHLGKYSFTIYILHWPVMLLIRIVGYQLLHIPFLIVAVLMVIGGYIIPVIFAELYIKFKEKKKFNSKILYYLLGI